MRLISKFQVSSSVDYKVREFVNNIIVPVLIVLDYVDEDQKINFLKGKNADPLTCLAKQKCSTILAKYLSDELDPINKNNLNYDLKSIYEYLFLNGYSNEKDLAVGRFVFRYNQMPSVIEKFNFVLI